MSFFSFDPRIIVKYAQYHDKISSFEWIIFVASTVNESMVNIKLVIDPWKWVDPLNDTNNNSSMNFDLRSTDRVGFNLIDKKEFAKKKMIWLMEHSCILYLLSVKTDYPYVVNVR